MNPDRSYAPIALVPIGYVRSPRQEIVDDGWGPIVSVIELDSSRFGGEALRGISEFSHLEIVFYFDRCREEATEMGARRPRGRQDLPAVGVFAQRVKDRPNHIGVSRCALVEATERSVVVRGLDAIDGTPVLDIKPLLAAFTVDRAEVVEPTWVSEVMASYY